MGPLRWRRSNLLFRYLQLVGTLEPLLPPVPLIVRLLLAMQYSVKIPPPTWLFSKVTLLMAPRSFLIMALAVSHEPVPILMMVLRTIRPVPATDWMLSVWRVPHGMGSRNWLCSIVMLLAVWIMMLSPPPVI